MSSFTGEIQVRIYRNKIPIVTQPINLSASRFFKADCKEKSLTRKLKPWRFLCCKKAANSHYSCKSARESRQIYRNTQFVAKKRWQRIRPWGATWLTLLLCACALSLVHQKFTQVVDLEDVFRPSAAFFYMLHHCLPSIFSVDLTFIFIWVQKRKVINKRLIFLVPERYLHAPNDLKLFPQCLPQKSKNPACFFLDCVKASAANIAIHHDAASFPRRWQKDPRTQSLRSTP